MPFTVSYYGDTDVRKTKNALKCHVEYLTERGHVRDLDLEGKMT